MSLTQAQVNKMKITKIDLKQVKRLPVVVNIMHYINYLATVNQDSLAYEIFRNRDNPNFMKKFFDDRNDLLDYITLLAAVVRKKNEQYIGALIAVNTINNVIDIYKKSKKQWLKNKGEVFERKHEEKYEEKKMSAEEKYPLEKDEKIVLFSVDKSGESKDYFHMEDDEDIYAGFSPSYIEYLKKQDISDLKDLDPELRELYDDEDIEEGVDDFIGEAIAESLGGKFLGRKDGYITLDMNGEVIEVPETEFRGNSPKSEKKEKKLTKKRLAKLKREKEREEKRERESLARMDPKKRAEYEEVMEAARIRREEERIRKEELARMTPEELKERERLRELKILEDKIKFERELEEKKKQYGPAPPSFQKWHDKNIEDLEGWWEEFQFGVSDKKIRELYDNDRDMYDDYKKLYRKTRKYLNAHLKHKYLYINDDNVKFLKNLVRSAKSAFRKIEKQ